MGDVATRAGMCQSRGMRRRRALFLSAVGLSFIAAIVAACVGDDPAPSASSTNDAATVPETGTTPDTGSSSDAGTDTNTTDAADDVAKRHCELVTKPQAPTEFFCADFDGTDPSEGWTTTIRPDGGTFALTKEAAVSLPQALVVQPANGVGNGSGPALKWTSVGPKNFARAELRAKMNPSNAGGVTSYDGDILLLEVRTSNALAAFGYTQGGTVGANTNYSGYFIRVAAFGGAAIQNVLPVTTPLTQATWTDVKLTYDSAGRVVLTYNNVSVFDQTNYGSTDTKVTFTVGAASSGNVVEPKQMRYDDVEVTLFRQP